MGRPKSFQPDEVLDRAVDVFWEKGYEGASVDDLTRAMGINRFSMYSTFGDKHELFLKALEKYERVWRDEVLPKYAQAGSLEALQALVYEAIDAQLACASERCGCVMVLAAITMAPRDEACRVLVEDHHRALECAFESALATAHNAGELGGWTPAEGARFLAVLMRGLVVSAVGGDSRTALRKTVRRAFDALRGP